MARLVADFCFLVLLFGVTTQAQPAYLLFLLFSLFFYAIFPCNTWLVVAGSELCRKTLEISPKIRGPIGWPLLGSIPLMGPLAHQKLATISASLNATRLMAFTLGAARVVISSHPETAKEILCGPAFSNRPIRESVRLLMFERAIGFAPSGEYWRNLRRIAATHMFSPKRIAGLEGLRQRLAGEILDGVWRGMEERGVVELRGILQKAALSNVVGSVFGEFSWLESSELGEMVNEAYELIGRFNWEDYFYLGFLDFGGVRKRCRRLAVKVNGLVGQIIEERKREGKYTGEDFLSVLLALPQEGRLSDSDMVAVLWEMIFRGTDTVAILLEWIMARIVLHPNIQSKAQKELDRCVGHSRHVRDSDLPNLPYLRSIVKEVLRMHPPGPLLSWARLAIHDVNIGGFFVPAGTTAMVNMWAITHDESIWQDAWAFRPERFIEEEVNVMGSDLRLAPFGSGRRACPGKALGLATVHLWLARLLHQFTWTRVNSVDLSECLRLSLEMKKPLKCGVVSRNFVPLEV